MKQNGLLKFEYIVQDLVEGKLGRLFGGRLEPLDVAGKLARVLEANITSSKLPQIYFVELNSEDYQFLTTRNPDLSEDIADASWSILLESGEVGLEKPQVTLKVDPTLGRHKVRITAQDATIFPDSTENTKIIHRQSIKSKPIPNLDELDAFLIVQGKRHVQLNKPLITIGRHFDNDIVIDKGSVSRKHALLRWRFGRFVLYDISTKGKTLVNGQVVLEHLLQPGDVITLSDVLLIYGEGQERRFSKREDQEDDMGDTIVRRSQE